MRSLLLVLALLSSTVLQAQQFSGGARTGIGFWRGGAHNYETGVSETTKPQTTWEKEIFFRYEPGKRFAFEAGLTHFEAEGEREFSGSCGNGLPETYMTGGSIRETYYGLNLRAQYDFSCPRMKKFSHFAGVALTPQLYMADSRDDMINGPTGDQYVQQSSVSEARFGFAFEDMLRYRVSRHLDVHSLIACRANVNSTLLVHGFTMQLGAAYHF